MVESIITDHKQALVQYGQHLLSTKYGLMAYIEVKSVAEGVTVELLTPQDGPDDVVKPSLKNTTELSALGAKFNVSKDVISACARLRSGDSFVLRCSRVKAPAASGSSEKTIVYLVEMD